MRVEEDVGMRRVVVAAIVGPLNLPDKTHVVETPHRNGHRSLRATENIGHVVEGDRALLREENSNNQPLQPTETTGIVPGAKLLNEVPFSL